MKTPIKDLSIDYSHNIDIISDRKGKDVDLDLDFLANSTGKKSKRNLDDHI